MSTGTVRDPRRNQLAETRKALVAAWTRTADQLDAQEETILAGEVRYFCRHLPPVLTDRERLAAQYPNDIERPRVQEVRISATHVSQIVNQIGLATRPMA